MKNTKKKLRDADAEHELIPNETGKLRRKQEVREKISPTNNRLDAQNASGLNEKEDQDEMEDLHREEENRGRLEAV